MVMSLRHFFKDFSEQACACTHVGYARSCDALVQRGDQLLRSQVPKEQACACTHVGYAHPCDALVQRGSQLLWSQVS